MTRVNLGGKERPVKFGMGAFLHIEKQTGKTLTEFINGISSNLSMTDMVIMVFGALAGGAIAAKEPVDFNMDDVVYWLESEGDTTEVVNKITELFADSLPKPKEGNAKAGAAKKG